MVEHFAVRAGKGVRALLADARALQRAGKVTEAEQRCADVLRIDRTNAAALSLLGTLREQQGRFEEAVRLFARSLEIDERQTLALNGLGRVLRRLGRHDEAVAAYDRAIALKPDAAAAFYNRGGALRDLHRHEAALADYERAISLRPDFAQAHFNRALILQDAKRFEDALAGYIRALQLKPDFLEAHHNRGNVLMRLGRHDDALASYAAAISLDPDCAETYNSRGAAFRACRRHEEALVSCDKAIALKPGYAEAYNNRGLALEGLHRRSEALASYDRAIALNRNDPNAYQNRGAALREIGHHDAALASFDRAVSLRPGDAAAHHERCLVLLQLERFDEALADLDEAIRLDPEFPYALGLGMDVRQRICDWRGLDAIRNAVRAGIERGSRVATPFSLLALDSSADIRRRCAEIYVRDKYPAVAAPSVRRQPRKRDRIYLAYLSADFRAHATATLASGVFEEHNRKRFKTCAVSFGPDDRSPMRTRLENAFELFVDVQQEDDHALAELLRDLEIDIAVDLMGFTKGCRTGIFALRPAPIQVNYLGFAGTIGASYIDYLIADRIVLPQHEQSHYVEKIAYLPDTYQCTDSKRRMIDKTLNRRDAGLPAKGFVFCSFNGTFKITPEVFDIWMRLLGQTDGSVLWLLESNAVAAQNLRREAEARGIARERLVFAPIVPHANHLARLGLADLFLDTLPCCAHTTASDALWAGLPLLTCLGELFSGRVAASLLHAVGLPDMVAHSLAAYEACALRLARDPAALSAVKGRLLRNLQTHPLFDTVRLTRHLEAAYEYMMERYRNGEVPMSFSVSAVGP